MLVGKKLLFPYALALAIIASPAAADIRWELRYPYRMFHQPSTVAGTYFREPASHGWEVRQALYFDSACANDPSPILCSERRLGATRRRDASSHLVVPQRHIASTEGYRRLTSQWIGDAYIGIDHYYDQTNLRYYGFESPLGSRLIQDIPDQFIGGVSRRQVNITLDGNAFNNVSCEWQVDDIPPIVQSCGSILRVSMKRGTPSSNVTVTVLETGEVSSISGEDTRIDEFLIVSMGDSYSSGEGAPDFQAMTRFEHTSRNRDSGSVVLPGNPQGVIRRVSPINQPNNPSANAAQWLDRDCHRSFLAAPSRAAIQFAIEYPQTEVVHVNLACSGAEVFDGIVGTYSRTLESSAALRDLQEILPPDPRSQLWRTNLSQLNQAILLLCESADIQGYIEAFNGYFEDNRNYFLEDERYRLPHDDPFQEVIDCPGGLTHEIDLLTMTIVGNDVSFMGVVHQALWSGIEGRLAKIFADYDPRVEFQDAAEQAENNIADLYAEVNDALINELELEPGQIVGSTYPIGTQDTDGTLCDDAEGLQHFNVIRFLDPHIDEEESAGIQNVFGQTLNTEIELAVNRLGWHLISAKNLFDGRGWCAGNQRIDYSGRLLNGYINTRRWIRTPNDAVAVQNQRPVDREVHRGRTVNRLLSTYGVMHPNALGAAAWGDLYLQAFEQILIAE